ncbi:bifunctional tRNA (5-methylaminomethyl-2-thiouridine)(34)-methyltransferase MnmD/FAD-dependent 5-carboxymethylaminomethyl-2-thiouridine(34) oxidoreductase MnmC [Celerinatantimonas sp. MCCC 1A17872]|uniref:bifunctional tRNA (5-methylaminomethyl-2-thiouridine)(34)-methyltransferase MnmD/FAD-dependent 5-carboxymethylaminomethyl-2-thiouridine(34) oxidoreductase MnmC n=1 Tax=Celerinatantimonas sp. MCCC 1A17872 TaxID=3177514 RepID=UPI0038C42A56
MVKPIHSADLAWNEQGYPVACAFDDVYFSNQDGLAETRYVFLNQNQLPQRWYNASVDHFTIAESGFGSGLNFLATWFMFDQLPQEHRPKQINFVSFEKFPLEKSDIAQTLAHWSELKPYAEQLIAHYPTILTQGCQRLVFANGAITLDLWFGDIHESLEQIPTPTSGLVDCWYLDGFAPSKNPDMWSQSLFDKMASLSKNQATLATFTAAGFVRRGLIEAGFSIEKAPGFGRKREMLHGHIERKSSYSTIAPWFYRHKAESLDDIAIIGAGLAGASLSYALSKRGIKHSVFESESSPATAASGNRQGAIYPLLNADQPTLSEFFISAFAYLNQTIHELSSQGHRIAFAQSGVLHLGYNEKAAKKLAKTAQAQWPETLIKPISAEQASDIAGLALEHSGLFYPQGLWATPADLVQAMLSQASASGYGCVQYQHQLTSWQTQEDGKIRLNFANQSSKIVSQLVLCNGHQITDIATCEKLPITPVRGQVTHLKSASPLSDLRTVLCYDGYLTPAHNHSHCIGATYQRGRLERDLSDDDTHKNLAALRNCITQAWTENLNVDDSQGRAAVRATVRDHLPLMGPVPNIDMLTHEYPQLNTQKSREAAPQLPLIENVYTISGLGARGVTSAPLLGELLACELSAETMPVSQKILDALHPARFWVRRLLRGQPATRD